MRLKIVQATGSLIIELPDLSEHFEQTLGAFSFQKETVSWTRIQRVLHEFHMAGLRSECESAWLTLPVRDLRCTVPYEGLLRSQPANSRVY
jgi:hypothetical protein